MKKVLGTMVVAILALGLLTGCPDDDSCTDCSCDPSLCDGDTDTDAGGADADADSDADSDVVEDDAAPESDVTYPNVAGDWNLTYHNDVTGMDAPTSLHLDQDGNLITGYDGWDCEYSGTISERWLSLRTVRVPTKIRP